MTAWASPLLTDIWRRQTRQRLPEPPRQSRLRRLMALRRLALCRRTPGKEGILLVLLVRVPRLDSQAAYCSAARAAWR